MGRRAVSAKLPLESAEICMTRLRRDVLWQARRYDGDVGALRCNPWCGAV